MMFLAGLVVGLALFAFAFMAFAWHFIRELAD